MASSKRRGSWRRMRPHPSPPRGSSSPWTSGSRATVIHVAAGGPSGPTRAAARGARAPGGESEDRAHHRLDALEPSPPPQGPLHGLGELTGAPLDDRLEHRSLLGTSTRWSAAYPSEAASASSEVASTRGRELHQAASRMRSGVDGHGDHARQICLPDGRQSGWASRPPWPASDLHHGAPLPRTALVERLLRTVPTYSSCSWSTGRRASRPSAPPRDPEERLLRPPAAELGIASTPR